jgi:uncharacterized protein YndB with AHSA1/START domain
VFDAWLNPQQAARFFFATRTGNIMKCEMDPVVGGSFAIIDRRPTAEGDESIFLAEHRGTYLQIDRPNVIVFDFHVEPYYDARTHVMLEFTPLGAQACEVALTHELGEGEMAHLMEDQTRRGWVTMLATLERELFPRRVGVQL